MENIDQHIEFHLPYLSGKGGTETVLLKVANHFPNSKICSYEGLGDYSWLDDLSDEHELFFNNSKECSSNKLKTIKRRLEYINYLRKTKSEILICLDSFTIKMAALARKLFSKKYKIISWVHFSLDNAYWINKHDMSLADYHLSISSGITRQLEKIDGISKDKIFTIYNPFNETNEVINISPKTPMFVYVGRVELYSQKNLAELLLALKRIKELNWKMTFYGTGADLDSVKEKCKEYGLTKKITFRGWVSDPWKEIDSASATLLTSNFEGFPMIIGESISRGLPVISSNCPTGPEDIITAKNGFLYEMGNHEELSEILKKMIEEKNLFSSHSVKESINKFYSENYYKELENILYNIFEGEKLYEKI